MPSRMAMLTGKVPDYTGVYRNMACKPIRDYTDNEIFVLPEYLKDSAGYFTYGAGKIALCYDTYPEYDTLTTDPCAKTLSWNKYIVFPGGEQPDVKAYGDSVTLGQGGLRRTPIPDSMETKMWDYQATDSLIAFINAVGSGADPACGKPLMLTIGYKKPHQTLYIPEKYFSPYYQDSWTSYPYRKPYNFPEGSSPYNGIVMPPQPPEGDYADYFALPADSLWRFMADTQTFINGVQNNVNAHAGSLQLDPSEDSLRDAIMDASVRASLTIAYLAGLAYIDAQVQRLMDALQAYPELYENTIIVVAGDHGYALGEKRHWQKGTMWETDLRVPFFITDLRMTTTPEVYNVVSLLDIFPTLCTVAGVPLPRTSDGTLYPDGYDLSGQMHSDMPELEWPVLSSYLQQPGTGQGTCFPQHSVRNNRFHFIQYTSNGDSWEEACNAAEAWREEELYEIGTYRDIDPNEWNNLIRQDYYQPVRDYLAQWLPGGDMYLKITYKSNIISNISECLVDREGVIDVTVTLTDSNGMA